MPDALIRYRRHAGAITHSRRHEQAQNCAAIGRRNLAARLPLEIAQGLEPLIALFSYNAKATPASAIARAGAACALPRFKPTAGNTTPIVFEAANRAISSGGVTSR